MGNNCVPIRAGISSWVSTDMLIAIGAHECAANIGAGVNWDRCCYIWALSPILLHMYYCM